MLIDIGIACNKSQPHQWWAQIMGCILKEAWEGKYEINMIYTVGGASPDFPPNEISSYFFGPSITAVNRTEIANDHVDDAVSEAIFWIDDDTVFPEGTIPRLIELDTDIAAGVYYLRNEPYQPVVYTRVARGGYVPLWDFAPGEVLTTEDGIHSVGMGCTLIKRYVYEKIVEDHVLMARGLTGTLMPIHKDDLVLVDAEQTELARQAPNKVFVDDSGHGFRVQALRPLNTLPRRWPFYAMEWERTEDHHFNEMALRCGFNITVDTALECSHWGLKRVDGEDFRKMRMQRLITEGESEDS